MSGSLTPAELVMLQALQKAYQGDAIFRPSNASRWMSCHGSVQLIGRLPRGPQRSSAAARQGSAAHALAETVLTSTQGLEPEDFVGRTVMISETPFESVLVDDEMAEKVGDYVAIVDGYRETPGTEILVERKLSLQALDPNNPLLNECRGTGDIIAINREQRWIIILDLKYGVGVPVAGNSPQPKIYLLMALLQFWDGKPWAWGCTTIYQPRLPVPPYTEDDHYKPFVFKPSDITGNFAGEVLEAMYAALQPDPKLTPSISACRWCEAARADICPAFRASGLNVGYQASGAVLQPPNMTVSAILQPMPIVSVNGGARPPAVNGMVLPAPPELTPYQLSNLVYGAEMLELWLTSAKHRAVQLLEAGVRLPPTDEGSPGFHLKARTGNRRWAVSRATVETELLKLGLKVNDIYTEPKIKTPKQVEDVLPKLLKGAIAPFVERPPGSPTLVAGDAKPNQPETVLTSLTAPYPDFNKPNQD